MASYGKPSGVVWQANSDLGQNCGAVIEKASIEQTSACTCEVLAGDHGSPGLSLAFRLMIPYSELMDSVLHFRHGMQCQVDLTSVELLSYKKLTI